MPKGVAITHHNVTQLCESLDAGLELAAATGVDAVSLVCLRLLGVGDLGALLHGGRLVVVPESVAGSPEDFHAVLLAEQVSVLTQTPSAVGAFSAEGLGVGGVADRR